jgi:hypothetical protein
LKIGGFILFDDLKIEVKIEIKKKKLNSFSLKFYKIGPSGYLKKVGTTSHCSIPPFQMGSNLLKKR